MPYGDRRSVVSVIRSKFNFDINYKSTCEVRIETTICQKCGNYIRCNKGREEVYCKCNGEDNWLMKFRQIHEGKLSHVLDELVYKRETDTENDTEDEGEDEGPLKPCPQYGHEGPCEPNSRRCKICVYPYRCKCGTSLGGMMGKCYYKKCREGLRNRLNR